MAMYTLKGIGEISTDAFDEKITLRNLLQHFSFYDFIIVDTKQNILFQYNSNDDWFHNLISLKKFYIFLSISLSIKTHSKNKVYYQNH